MDLGNFDKEAFIDGYIQCALWADCLPHKSERVEELEVEIAAAYALGRVPEYQLNELASIEEVESLELGGRADLELRPGAREKMVEGISDFVECHIEDLRAYCEQMGEWHGPTDSLGNSSYSAEECAGHDFWFTRNGHGVGYWARDLGDLGERLTEAAKAYGSADDHTPYDCGDGTADV